jgi:hypothetical protein
VPGREGADVGEVPRLFRVGGHVIAQVFEDPHGGAL